MFERIGESAADENRAGRVVKLEHQYVALTPNDPGAATAGQRAGEFRALGLGQDSGHVNAGRLTLRMDLRNGVIKRSRHHD